jgi:hypothetical protein
MTKEELEDNYEYKVTKKALMKEFPFVKNVYAKDDDDINKWKYALYLELVIDPYILGHMYGIPVWSIVTRSLQRGEDYWAPYLGTFFQDRDATEKINKDMETLMNGIHKSPALPNELKLHKQLEIGTFITYPKYLPPILNGNDEMTLPN